MLVQTNQIFVHIIKCQWCGYPGSYLLCLTHALSLLIVGIQLMHYSSRQKLFIHITLYNHNIHPYKELECRFIIPLLQLQQFKLNLPRGFAIHKNQAILQH